MPLCQENWMVWQLALSLRFLAPSGSVYRTLEGLVKMQNILSIIIHYFSRGETLLNVQYSFCTHDVRSVVKVHILAYAMLL